MKTYWLVKDRIFHNPDVAIELMGKNAFYEHSIEVVEADSLQPIFKAAMLISELLDEVTSNPVVQKALDADKKLLLQYRIRIKQIQDILGKIDQSQKNEL